MQGNGGLCLQLRIRVGVRGKLLALSVQLGDSAGGGFPEGGVRRNKELRRKLRVTESSSCVQVRDNSPADVRGGNPLAQHVQLRHKLQQPLPRVPGVYALDAFLYEYAVLVPHGHDVRKRCERHQLQVFFLLLCEGGEFLLQLLLHVGHVDIVEAADFRGGMVAVTRDFGERFQLCERHPRKLGEKPRCFRLDIKEIDVHCGAKTFREYAPLALCIPHEDELAFKVCGQPGLRNAFCARHHGFVQPADRYKVPQLYAGNGQS